MTLRAELGTGGGKASGESRKELRWSLRHPRIHGIACAVVGGAVGFLAWWVVAEAITPDGHNMWWERWYAIAGLLSAAVAGGLGGWAAWALRRRWRVREGEEASLLWLVFGGVLVSVVLGAALTYAQAELLTAPGVAVGSLKSEQFVDVARSATLGLGALGAVAVLIVNYRKQKSTEATLVQDRQKHDDDLAHERKKQDASEIAALHERYTKAVEQLAEEEKPAIRLGGVHAIAALGDDWHARGNHRQLQACVDLLCSYLRSVPRADEDVDPASGDIVDWEYDLEFLARDRDVRLAALEWLSRVATAQVALPAPKEGAEPAPRVTINLEGVVLRRLDLSHAKLAHLPLKKAKLMGANLTSAKLTETNLQEADLSHANLLKADLSDAHLENAKVNGTSKLVMADLRGAHMTNAELRGADLTGAKLQGADFVSADLTGAIFHGAPVDRKTSFTSAILDGADFTAVRVWLLDLDGVDYSKTKNFPRTERRARAASEDEPGSPSCERDEPVSNNEDK
ncbi:pentapeptide repeat-containing protein [Prescottella equi]|uniref:pentapeptide repeat-containing protein n=1 Tax=Rhodococcus hoagii TaxID=43767 RepID=UPI0007CD77F8|nr:pentapeptide repeat-containing protein [Prescottella equi]